MIRRWRPARVGHLHRLHPFTVPLVLARHHLARRRWIGCATGRMIRRYEHPAPGDMIDVDIKKLGRIPAGGGWEFRGRTRGNRANVQTDPATST